MGTLYGGVVYHRWFANGAGWAYHPDAGGGSPAEQPGLTKALDERRLGALACAVTGGVLWGEQVLDPECPDPKAATRTPTILRAVFLPAGPRTPEQGAAILAALRAFSPAEAGADAYLIIPQSLIPPEPSRGVRRAGLAVLGALLVVGSGVAVWQLSAGNAPGGAAEKRDPDPNPKPPVPPNGTPSPGPGKERPETPAEKFAKLVEPLRRVLDDKSKAGTPGQVVRQFFARYAAPALPPAPAPGQPPEHPDLAFARRFPQNPPALPEGQWTEAALRQELKILHQRLTGEPAAPNQIADQVAAIEGATDYVRWLNNEGVRHLKGKPVEVAKGVWEFRFPLDQPVPDDVRNFAYRFVRPDDDATRPEQIERAKEYLPLLKKWGVNGIDPSAPERRPALVLHAVIGFVTDEPFFDERKLGEKTYAAAVRTMFAKLREEPNAHASPHNRAEHVIRSVFGSVENATKGLRAGGLLSPESADGDRGERSFFLRFKLR